MLITLKITCTALLTAVVIFLIAIVGAGFAKSKKAKRNMANIAITGVALGIVSVLILACIGIIKLYLMIWA